MEKTEQTSNIAETGAKEKPLGRNEKTADIRIINGMTCIIPNGENHIPKNTPVIVRTKDITLLFDVLDIAKKTGGPVAYRGPTGTGKTMAVRKYCEINRIQLLTVDCSNDQKVRHLEGTVMETQYGLAWVAGPLVQAIELANKLQETIFIVFEEVNTWRKFTQKRTNSFFDWRCNVSVPLLSHTFELEGDAKVVRVSTMNPTAHGGVEKLNIDFMSRWSIYDIDFPTKDEEEKILNAILVDQVKDVPELKDMFPKLTLLAQNLRHGSKTGLSYLLSTRDVIKLARNYGYARPLKGSARAIELMRHELESYYSSDEISQVKLRFNDCIDLEVV